MVGEGGGTGMVAPGWCNRGGGTERWNRDGGARVVEQGWWNRGWNRDGGARVLEQVVEQGNGTGMVAPG